MVIFSGLVEAFLTEVDIILQNYVYDGYQAMVNYLAAPLGVAIVLFFIFYGIGIMQGWLEGSFGELMRSLLKIGLIYFVGMNWGYFSEYVCSVFYVAAGQIGDVLVKASPINLPSSGGEGINDALQTVLTQIWTVAQNIISNGGISNPGPWLGGILVGAVGLILVGLALLEMVVAKCMLSILFVVAPLFIAFTLFKPTQFFFDRWLGACVGYAMLMIFVCASLGIIIQLDYWVLADAYIAEADKIPLLNIAVIILVTWVCVGILRRIAGLAMHIGDSVSTVGSAALIGDFFHFIPEGSGSSQPKRPSANRKRSSHPTPSIKRSPNAENIRYTMKRLRNGET